MKLGLIMIFFIGWQAQAADFGSSEFTHYDLEGDYRVTCIHNGMVDTQIHRCAGYLLRPSSWAWFFHDNKKLASRVVLSRVNSDGRKVTKRSDWDNQKKRSTDKINLWVKTLLQRPLLDFGKNQVDYSLYNEDTQVESGQFEVEVLDGGLRTCASLSETFGDDTYCKSASQACSRFFRIKNNCF